MVERQTTKRPYNQAPSVAATDDENDLPFVSSEAERYFLRQQYQKALSICNGYFSRHINNSSNLIFAGDNHNDEEEDDAPLSSLTNHKKITLSKPLMILDKNYSISVAQQQQQRSNKTKIKRNNLNTAVTSSSLASLMAVALQSWYELDKLDHQQQNCKHGNKNNVKKTTNNKSNWKHLQPLLEYIQQYSIPPSMEFLVIWIYFWEKQPTSQQQQQQDYEAIAMDWTLQVLFETTELLEHDGDDGTHNREQDDFFQELWIHCMTEQLPKLTYSSSTLSILVLALLKVPNESQDIDAATALDIVRIRSDTNDTMVLSDSPSLSNISMILEVLRKAWQESNHGDNDGPRYSQWIAKATQQLQTKQQKLLLLLRNSDEEAAKGEDEKFSSDPSSMTTTSTSIIQARSNRITEGSSGRGYNFDSLQSWIHKTYQQLRRILTSTKDSTDVVSSSPSSSSILSARSRLGISIFLLLFTIRYRIRINKTVKAMLVSLLAPVTELIQALGTTTQEDGKRRHQ